MKHPAWLRTPPTAVALAVATAIGLVAAPALAQNTTSGITGTVTGADGKPVAGATVTIVHAESGSTSTSTTDAAGRYSARGLRPGVPYTLTISKGGQTEKKEGLVLSLAETFSYDAQLGAAAQVVTVTGRAGSDQFNKGNMGAGAGSSRVCVVDGPRLVVVMAVLLLPSPWYEDDNKGIPVPLLRSKALTS